MVKTKKVQIFSSELSEIPELRILPFRSSGLIYYIFVLAYFSNNIDYRLQNCADGATVLMEIPSDGSTEVELPISCDILYFCVQSVLLLNLNLNEFLKINKQQQIN